MDEPARREFVDFVTARTGALFRVAYALTERQHLGEDLLQSALEKVAVRWHRIEDPERYVKRVMYHEYVSWWRRRRRETAFLDTALADSSQGADPTDHAAMVDLRRSAASPGSSDGHRLDRHPHHRWGCRRRPAGEAPASGAGGAGSALGVGVVLAGPAPVADRRLAGLRVLGRGPSPARAEPVDGAVPGGDRPRRHSRGLPGPPVGNRLLERAPPNGQRRADCLLPLGTV